MTDTLPGSPRPLTADHDVALLDLDGVVYVGPDAVPGAPEALQAARDSGMRLAFVTNNAARPPFVVADHLTGLGIAASANEVITSSQAAARYLADRLPGGARVLVVGTTGLEVALTERGLTPVSSADGRVDAVVQGYSPDLDWAQLAEGAVAINSGVLWVATNIDPTVPSPRGPLPGNGSLVAALRHATGRDPIVTGKPDPTMHRETVLRTEATSPIVVGDRLDTDIEGANAVGCASLLVFTGVTAPVDLVTAPAQHRPTFIGNDLSALLIAHPPVTADQDAWRCGNWTARHDGTRVAVDRHEPADAASEEEQGSSVDSSSGPGPAFHGRPALSDDDLDALRVVCAAAWHAADAAHADAGQDGADEVAEVSVTPSDGADDRIAAVLERLGLSA